MTLNLLSTPQQLRSSAQPRLFLAVMGVNNFINRWGLSVSEDQDSSLGFPANMPKHVVVMDGNDPEQHAAWGSLEPSHVIKAGEMKLGIPIKIDLSITTRIPYNPPAPDNGDTPATQN